MLEFLTAQSISTLVLAGVLVLLGIIIIKKPFGCLIRLVANTIGGFIALFVINYLGAFVGISIGINWMNAIIVGIFGLPGVGFLLIFPLLMA